MKAKNYPGTQTERRFRVCDDCGELFSMVQSIRHHQQETGHSGVNHITATVQE